MKKLISKFLNRETIMYVIFGVLTTVVNYAVYFAMNFFVGEKFYLVNNLVAWVFAVAFAFVTNKQYVFNSRVWTVNVIWPELIKFVSSRLFSLGVEEAGLWLFVRIFTMNENIAKLILAVIVIVLNYILSKLLVFIRKEDSCGGKEKTQS